jgi:hypothetical protein
LKKNRNKVWLKTTKNRRVELKRSILILINIKIQGTT